MATLSAEEGMKLCLEFARLKDQVKAIRDKLEGTPYLRLITLGQEDTNKKVPKKGSEVTKPRVMDKEKKKKKEEKLATALTASEIALEEARKARKKEAAKLKREEKKKKEKEEAKEPAL